MSEKLCSKLGKQDIESFLLENIYNAILKNNGWLISVSKSCKTLVNHEN